MGISRFFETAPFHLEGEGLGQKTQVWIMASLCLFWCVWWERNKRIFDGEELNIYKLAKNPYEVSFEIVWKPVGEGMCFSVGFLLIIRTTDSGFFSVLVFGADFIFIFIFIFGLSAQ